MSARSYSYVLILQCFLQDTERKAAFSSLSHPSHPRAPNSFVPTTPSQLYQVCRTRALAFLSCVTDKFFGLCAPRNLRANSLHVSSAPAEALVTTMARSQWVYLVYATVLVVCLCIGKLSHFANFIRSHCLRKPRTVNKIYLSD